MQGVALSFGLGVLVAAALFPIMKWQFAHIESDKKGLGGAIKYFVAVLVECFLIFGEIFLILYLVRAMKPEDKADFLIAGMLPSVGFFIYFLFRYLVPAMWRADKRKRGL